MRESHKGLRITNAEFDLLVQFLRDALDRNKVGESEKNELLRLLAPMKRDIVFG
jgi:hemoglobin